MKRSVIRKFLKEIFLEKPKKKWEATLRSVDRAIWLGWSGIITVVAFTTNNVGTILIILWAIIGGFIFYYYFLARGR